MNGLAKHTEKVFEYVSKMDCVKDYTLMGGTALALQLGHRLSEDLDFCKWHKANEKVSVYEWADIKRQLSQLGDVQSDWLSESQCDFLVNGVKLTFFADNRLEEPKCLQRLPFLNHLTLVDVATIGVMKLEVMSRRGVFRDYYDMYAILKSGVSLADIMSATSDYTSYDLRRKNMFNVLMTIDHIAEDHNFQRLQPIYNVDLLDIQHFLLEKIKEYIVANSLQNKTSLTSVLERTVKEQPLKIVEKSNPAKIKGIHI
jgi:predicted nucleotidyltransferase component of viral defense system